MLYKTSSLNPTLLENYWPKIPFISKVLEHMVSQLLGFLDEVDGLDQWFPTLGNPGVLGLQLAMGRRQLWLPW